MDSNAIAIVAFGRDSQQAMEQRIRDYPPGYRSTTAKTGHAQAEQSHEMLTQLSSRSRSKEC